MADNMSDTTRKTFNLKKKGCFLSLFYSVLVTVTLLLLGMVNKYKVLVLGMKCLAARQYFPLFHSYELP